MKYAIALAALIFSVNAAQAKTVCNINSGKDDVYGKILFSGEVGAGKYFIVNKNKSAAQEVRLDQFNTLEKWQAVDGLLMITFSPSQGAYGITVGQIDVSKGATNMLPLIALVTGPVTEKAPLSLTMPAKNLSLACFELNY